MSLGKSLIISLLLICGSTAAEASATTVRDTTVRDTVFVCPDTTSVCPDTLFVPMFGISTNLLYDITYVPKYGFTSIPSLSVEYYPAQGNWTFGADVDWSHWRHRNEHRYNQIHNLTLSARRYFKPTVTGFSGLYLSGNLNAAQYGIGWDEHGWEGEGLGVSLGVGYKWFFTHRLYLDFGIAAGFFYSQYDPYVWGDDSTGWYYYDYIGDSADFVRRRMALQWFGPTSVYISLGINLFDRNRSKK